MRFSKRTNPIKATRQKGREWVGENSGRQRHLHVSIPVPADTPKKLDVSSVASIDHEWEERIWALGVIGEVVGQFCSVLQT
jgi:hypothetical protein